VSELLVRGERVRGVRTEEDTLEAESVVLAAGAWSVPLAGSIGLELPIRPARVRVVLFERPYELPTHLTFIDTTEGFYARPAAERTTLVGSRDSLEWLDDPDAPTPEPEGVFIEDASRRLALRLPVLADAPYRSGRSGVLDMTPDGRPILGPAGPEGLYLAAGWSGTGFKKAPAVGAEMARWISEGSPKRPELRDYDLTRFEAGAPIRGEHEYAVSGPH
jgi:sarcosine oxidase, subunit beta